ncbi:MAG: flippase-like domain-containing protein [Spirochaetia bacterium]|nr:flippase-like domain-containing protein [Spirochaetia bacterium]
MKKVLVWLGFIITLVCLYFVVRGLDFGKMAQIVKEINIWMLCLTVAIYIAGYYIRANRWHYLLKHVKVLKTAELFPYLVMGFMFNNVLPARAGEFIRAFLTGTKKGVSKMTTFATVMIERVFDGMVMIIFFIIGYASFHYLDTLQSIEPVNLFGMTLTVKDAVLWFAFIGSGVFLAVFIFMFLLMYKKDATVAFIHKIMDFFPEKVREKTGGFIDTFISGLGILSDLKGIMIVFGLSLAAWTVEAFTYWLMGEAMNIHINMLLVCLIMAVANFAIMTPSTPGGVGPFEFFGVGIMLLFGFPKEQAAAYTFIVHMMILLPIIALGLIFMFREGLDFATVMKEKQKEEVK